MARIFYTAARECGYADPNKIEEILGIPVPGPPDKIAPKRYRTRTVTPRQVVRLSAAISVPNMLSIAKDHTMIPIEKLRNLKSEYQGETRNREIIKQWIHSDLTNSAYVSKAICKVWLN